MRFFHEWTIFILLRVCVIQCHKSKNSPSARVIHYLGGHGSTAVAWKDFRIGFFRSFEVLRGLVRLPILLTLLLEDHFCVALRESFSVDPMAIPARNGPIRTAKLAAVFVLLPDDSEDLLRDLDKS